MQLNYSHDEHFHPTIGSSAMFWMKVGIEEKIDPELFSELELFPLFEELSAVGASSSSRMLPIQDSMLVTSSSLSRRSLGR